MKKPLIASFWKHHPVFDQYAQGLSERTLSFQAATGCDFVKITPSGTWQAVCHGAQDEVWPGDSLGRRRIVKPLIETCDDWLALVDFQREVPDLLKQMTACCRSVSMAVTDRPVVFTLFNPITQAIQLAGLERFKEHGLTAPEKVRAGIERIAHNTRFAIDAFIEAGVKGIYYVTQHMQRGLIDPWVYSDFGMDADAGCLARAAGLELSIFHIHGERVFLMLPEMPANGIIHYELTADNMSPGMFHEKYPYRLMPGIPFSAIRACESDDDIRSCIDRHLVSDGGDGFMAAGCVLPVDFPEARIRRWVELSKAV